MRLCKSSGRSPTQIEQTWSETDFERLRIFDLLEPIGDVRMDVLISLLRSTIIGSMTGKSVPTSDLIPDWGKHLEQYLPPEPVDPLVTVARVKALLNRAARKSPTAKPPGPPPVPRTNQKSRVCRTK